MDSFRRFAVFTLARDASFVALAGSIIMVACSFAPALAFEMGASVALIFSIVLAGRAMLLTEERLLRSEVWYALEPHERPVGGAGQAWATDSMKDLLLRFAKSAAACAIALYLSALLWSLGQPDAAHVIVTAALK